MHWILSILLSTKPLNLHKSFSAFFLFTDLLFLESALCEWDLKNIIPAHLNRVYMREYEEPAKRNRTRKKKKSCNKIKICFISALHFICLINYLGLSAFKLNNDLFLWDLLSDSNGKIITKNRNHGIVLPHVVDIL